MAGCMLGLAVIVGRAAGEALTWTPASVSLLCVHIYLGEGGGHILREHCGPRGQNLHASCAYAE